MTYEFLFGKVPFGDEEDDPYAVYEKVQDRDLEYPRWADKQEKSKEKEILKQEAQKIRDEHENKTKGLLIKIFPTEGINYNKYINCSKNN